MESKSVKINCNVLYKFTYQLKDLLKFNFKVYAKVENENIIIHGNDEIIRKCMEMVSYYEKANSEYFLAINSYTQEALKINKLLLLFESQCNVLLSHDKSRLCLRGEQSHVTLLYEYLMKYDRLIVLENMTFVFDESNETSLNILCAQCDVVLPITSDLQTRVFIYNVLIDRDRLFSQISIEKVSSPMNNIEKFTSNNANDLSYNNLSCSPSDTTQDNDTKLRTVIIDGNNLAFGHGGDKFSAKGIKLAIEYFLCRGHSKVYAMVPRHRQPLGGAIFEQLEREDRLKYTPSRVLNNVRETPYDDRFILDAAVATSGVVLSNDQYRDLMDVESYHEIICDRLIPYTFIEDHLIVPNDPRGYKGPSLDTILAHPPKVVAKSPRRPHRGTAKTRSVSHHSELSARQMALYNRTIYAMPAESHLIQQIIVGNPGVNDPDTIMNLTLMALERTPP